MPTQAAARLCAADTSVRRDANINLRLSVQVRNLIDAAATAVGQTRTEFMISTARKHAIDVLLDQRFFHLEGSEASQFLNLLDNPPEPTEKLRQLLKRKAPWEK